MRNPKNNNLTKTFNGLIEATKRLGKVEGEINMANKLKDGSFYCPRCDTVWASPGKCGCEPAGLTKDTKLSQQSTAVWNAAIEAAAKEIEDKFDFTGNELLAAEQIRKLKK